MVPGDRRLGQTFGAGVIKEKVDVKDLITNELIGAINNLDPAKVAAEARAYKR